MVPNNWLLVKVLCSVTNKLTLKQFLGRVIYTINIYSFILYFLLFLLLKICPSLEIGIFHHMKNLFHLIQLFYHNNHVKRNWKYRRNGQIIIKIYLFLHLSINLTYEHYPYFSLSKI